jgi:hypothetical protein
MSIFTEKQRKQIYKDAAEKHLWYEKFGCFAILDAAREYNGNAGIRNVNRRNFPEFFKFKVPDSGGNVWLGDHELSPYAEAGYNLRHDVLMLCHEMCKGLAAFTILS